MKVSRTPSERSSPVSAFRSYDSEGIIVTTVFKNLDESRTLLYSDLCESETKECTGDQRRGALQGLIVSLG